MRENIELNDEMKTPECFVDSSETWLVQGSRRLFTDRFAKVGCAHRNCLFFTRRDMSPKGFQRYDVNTGIASKQRPDFRLRRETKTGRNTILPGVRDLTLNVLM